ncbi:MAG: acetolactate synthase large subunit [Syntrophales bacterium]
MNGAEVLVKTAAACGIEICFANAGTTEMPIVMAFDAVPAIRPILGLFEGVCTGAADGYGRMREYPAMTLLHLGPGLANGIANLHNARRARTPIVNVIGDHASWHREADAPLAMNIEGLAETVSGWLCTSRDAESLSQDMADAVEAALQGQIASLIVPHDHQWMQSSEDPVAAPPRVSCVPIDFDRIEATAGLLKSARKAVIIMDGKALRKSGLHAAARIKAATGCDLMSVTFPAYMDRGAGLPFLPRVPYFPEQAILAMSPYDAVILAGAREPVAFFGYENGASYLLDKASRKIRIAGDGQDAAVALEVLADALRAPQADNDLRAMFSIYGRPAVPEGKLTAEKACTILAALQPDHAIIVEEGLTSAFAYYPQAATVAPHSFITITGGAIGQGIPCATGAAVACPDRAVINLEADGSAMYTVQGLWTQAREDLNVTTLICSNRSYFILKVEMMRAGCTAPGPKSLSLSDLGNPAIDWVNVSQGMGVPAVSVTTAEDLAEELQRAIEEPGPHLIEMVL